MLVVPRAPSWPGTPATSSSLMVARPVSCPTGSALARHSLMPLYRAGLWLAVNIAPGQPNRPEAKYNSSVEASPMCTTSRPCAVTPSAKAAASSGEDSRMSCPTTTRVAPSPRINRAKEAPTSSTNRASIWSPTTPRTS
ncbi:Uncharacterised protein [Mycobacteroides abscessus subsp. abscessus]|nr:Uncharacterised protein [Mycobacteroides abscessus subsp. abscessus]